MQGNSNGITIPNVSCVFRELVQLSHTNPRLNSTQQSQTYTYKGTYDNKRIQPAQINNNFDFVTNMGLDDRQKRHQQLMNKLKNSLQQNRQLLGINNHTSNNQYQYESVNINTIESQYRPYNNSNNNPINKNNFYQNHNSIVDPKNQPKKWKIPQIKYRHIEDLQQKNTTQKRHELSQYDFVNESTTQSKLQKQFYENHAFEQNQNPGTSKNIQKKTQQVRPQNNKTRTQEVEYDQNDIDQEMAKKYSKFSNQPSKYNQNLESYYELCRKPIKPSIITNKETPKQNSKINQEKFLRKTQPKVRGINLQKAINILSLDD